MSPWEQRLMRDREEIATACGWHDAAIDAEPTAPPPMRVDKRIFLETDAPLPRGTFVRIVSDFMETNASRFTVDVGPTAKKMNNACLCILRAANRMGAEVNVRQKRGLVIIERAV